MNEKGVNILPMICFSVLLLVFFTGLILFGKGGEKAGADAKKDMGIINTYNIDESREISVTGKGRISIDAASTGVRIYTHADDSVKARLYGKVTTSVNNAVPVLELIEDGQSAVVKIKYPEVYRFYYSENLKLDVTIPESWLNELDIRTVSGDVSAQVLSGSDIKLKSSSGDIKVQDITGNNITMETVSGNVDIDTVNGENCIINSSSGDLQINKAVFSDSFRTKTVSGKCRINRLECKEAELQASSGDIEIKDVVSESVKSKTVSGSITMKMKNGSAELEASSGNIKAEFEEGFSSFRAKAVSGNVNLKLPENSEFSLDIKSVTGSIKCEGFPFSFNTSGDRRMTGAVGSGHGSVIISTSSGNITIGK